MSQKSSAIYQVGNLHLFQKNLNNLSSLFSVLHYLNFFFLIYGMSFLSVLKSQQNNKIDKDERMRDLLAL